MSNYKSLEQFTDYLKSLNLEPLFYARHEGYFTATVKFIKHPIENKVSEFINPVFTVRITDADYDRLILKHRK